MRDVTLYHGSRGGIDGKIQPISRLRYFDQLLDNLKEKEDKEYDD